MVYELTSEIKNKISEFYHLTNLVFGDHHSDESNIKLNDLLADLIIDFKQIQSMLFVSSANSDVNALYFSEFTDSLEKEVNEYRETKMKDEQMQKQLFGTK